MNSETNYKTCQILHMLTQTLQYRIQHSPTNRLFTTRRRSLQALSNFLHSCTLLLLTLNITILVT